MDPDCGSKMNFGMMNATNAVLENIKTVAAIGIAVARIARQVNIKIKTDKVGVNIAVWVNIKIQMHKVDVKVAQLDSIRIKMYKLVAKLATLDNIKIKRQKIHA